MSTNSASWRDVLATVEKLSWTDQLRLISELLLRMQNRATENKPVDLLDLAGVGADVWTDVDTDAYLNQERNRWPS